MLIVRCAWHEINFGKPLIIDRVDGKGIEGVSDGICEECSKIFFEGVKQNRDKRVRS